MAFYRNGERRYGISMPSLGAAPADCAVYGPGAAGAEPGSGAAECFGYAGSDQHHDQ